MSLQELLGKELYDQVIEKAGDKKIAIVSDGSYIPKQKFDDKLEEIKTLKTSLEERDTDLDDLRKKAKDSKELQNEIDALKQQYDTDKQEYETKLAQQKKESKLELALKDAKAKNPRAVKALLDAEKISLDGDNLIGLEEQLTALKESDGYLFGEEKPAGLEGRNPHPSNPNSQPPQKNPWKPGEINLTEQARILKEDPNLANSLKAQVQK